MKFNTEENGLLSLNKNVLQKSNENPQTFKRRREAKTKTVKFSNKLNLDFLVLNKSKASNFKKENELEKVDELADFNIDNRLKDKMNQKYDLELNGHEKKESGKIQRNISKIRTNDSLKNKTIKLKNNKIDTNSVQIKFKNNIDVGEMCNNEIILGTPNDIECPLVLSQKRIYNTKPSFFYESLNKIKELTKQEKIKTYKKEFTSQILKFNDLYFDPKIDDFYNDKLFNDVKATCDLFINKFTFDPKEQKNLSEIDNYL